MTTQASQKWNRVLLKDAVTFKTGKLNSNAATKNGKYPFFTCSQEVYKTDTFSFDTECVLLGGNNANAIYPIFYFKGKFDAYQRTYVIESKDNYIRFLYYLLTEKLNELRLQSTGSATKFLTIKILNQLPVELPDYLTQRQIADLLSTYDDLIENNTRRIQILEQTAQAVYKEWFTSLASKKWNVSTLRDVIDSYIGGGWGKEEPDKKYSGHAYVIRGTDIPNASTGNISTCPLRYHTPSNLRTRVLQAGDLVFEVSGGSKGQPVGRSLLITNNLLDQFKQNVICASFCKLIRPDQNKISSFQLYEQILGWYKNGVIEKYQVQSTGISNFRFESFIDEEKVILPPEEIREKFDHLVSPLFDEIYSLGKQNQNLRQTRNLLLPKLITGEIKV